MCRLADQRTDATRTLTLARDSLVLVWWVAAASAYKVQSTELLIVEQQ